MLLWFGIGVVALLLVVLLRNWSAGDQRRGRTARWLGGAGVAQQEADDLALQLKSMPLADLDTLQDWAVSTLARYDSGLLSTNRKADYWSAGDIALVRVEAETIVAKMWPEFKTAVGPEPAISVRLAPSGKAEAVVIAWYLRGVVVAPPTYTLTFAPWYSVAIRPGVYVYVMKK